jgi:hypothetical protein
MFSPFIPPAQVVRAIETARHRLGLPHQRLVPPQAAMMEMITDAWAAQAITTAAHLGIADALEDGPLSIDESAAAVGADADTVGRRLRALSDGASSVNGATGAMTSGCWAAPVSG